MTDIKSSYESIEQKIRKIEKDKEEALSKVTREKEELSKIVRSDFLVGGILASSLFLIINSLILYIGIIFPYNLLIGIGLLLVSLGILLKPIILSKLIIKNYNEKECIIFDQYIFQFLVGINAKMKLYRKEVFKPAIDDKIEEFDVLKDIISDGMKEIDDALLGMDKIDDLMNEINFPNKLRRKSFSKMTHKTLASTKKEIKAVSNYFNYLKIDHPLNDL